MGGGGVCKRAGEFEKCSCKVALRRSGPPLPWPQHPPSEHLRRKKRAPKEETVDHCVILQATWSCNKLQKSAQPTPCMEWPTHHYVV